MSLNRRNAEKVIAEHGALESLTYNHLETIALRGDTIGAVPTIKALFSREMPQLKDIKFLMSPSTDGSLLELSKHVRSVRSFEVFGSMQNIDGFRVIWRGAPILQSVVLRLRANDRTEECSVSNYRVVDVVSTFLDCPALLSLQVVDGNRLITASDRIKHKNRRVLLTKNHQLHLQYGRESKI